MDKVIRSPIALDIPGVVGFIVAVAVANAILKNVAPKIPVIGKFV